MNVNITINGDIHIHCGCCEDCGDFYESDFGGAYEMPDEDAGEISELPPEEAEAVLRAVAELILPFLQEAADERGTEHEGV